METSSFAAVVAERIESLGLSKAEAARRCGISRESMRAVLEGHVPSVERADAILRGMGLYARIGSETSRRRVDL